MSSRKARFIPIAGVFLFIVTVLGFTACLNILSFQRNYTDSLVSSYALAGKGIAGKIEYALKYGKPLDNYFGMRDLLAEVQRYLPEVENVLAVMPDGKIVAALNESWTGRRLDPELRRKLDACQESFLPNYFSTAQGGRQHVVVPIFNKTGWSGSLDIVFDKQIINGTINRFIRRLVEYLVLLSLGASLLFVCLFRCFAVDGHGQIRPKLLRIFLITVLTLAQGAYGYLNYHLFKTGYLHITRGNAGIASQVIRNDIQSVIRKGLTYGELYRLGAYLSQIVGALPEIAAIRLTDPRGRVFAASAGVSAGDWQKAPAEWVDDHRLPPDSQGESAKLSVLLSRANINRKIRDVLWDAVTLLTISFFLMWELTVLVMIVLRLKLNGDPETPGKSFWNRGGIRPLAFITYQAMFLTATFVPLMMKTFQHHLAGVSGELALGLPVSVEMFCGLAASVAGGYLIDRKGWRTAFTAGLFFFILGAAFSGAAAAPLPFIAARGLAGTGTGLLVIAMRNCVISQNASGNRSVGIAAMNAGAVSGINCGVVGGAMLADRIGFAGVFYIAAGLILLSLLFVKRKPAGPLRLAGEANRDCVSLGRFILNPQVLLFFVIILIPLGVCAMFLDYYFPVFADQTGLSTSNTGRAFLLNGLCTILLGPALSKWVLKKLGTGRSMVIGAMITAGAILIFAAFGSLTAALAALALLGVAESFGTAAQVEYFMNLGAVRKYGQGKSLSYFGLTAKLGNMLGPVIFGGAALLGIAPGMGAVGGMMLLLILIFAAAAGNSLKKGADR